MMYYIDYKAEFLDEVNTLLITLNSQSDAYDKMDRDKISKDISESTPTDGGNSDFFDTVITKDELISKGISEEKLLNGFNLLIKDVDYVEDDLRSNYVLDRIVGIQLYNIKAKYINIDYSNIRFLFKVKRVYLGISNCNIDKLLIRSMHSNDVANPMKINYKLKYNRINSFKYTLDNEDALKSNDIVFNQDVVLYQNKINDITVGHRYILKSIVSKTFMKIKNLFILNSYNINGEESDINLGSSSKMIIPENTFIGERRIYRPNTIIHSTYTKSLRLDSERIEAVNYLNQMYLRNMQANIKHKDILKERSHYFYSLLPITLNCITKWI